MASGTFTFLFTDLVDSTARFAAMEPERADSLRREHFALMRAATETTGGSEVKTIGDAFMVAFTSVQAAVACAIAMQQAQEVANRAASAARLDLRVGVSTGEAVMEDDDYFGEAVVEAARLCALAEPGEIRVSGVVEALCGGRGGFEFRPLGELVLKGFSQPVRAFEVAWAAREQTASTFPFPAALAPDAAAPFVGRDEQIGVLRRHWSEAEGGELRIVLIAGEPGIGKTRLVGEFANEVHSAGTTVLYGRCDDEAAAAYQPLVECLRFYAANATPDLLEAQAGRLAADLGRLVPEIRERPGGTPQTPVLESESDRYRLFEAIATFLENISNASQPAAAPRGLLLVLDDLHWADRPTLLALRHLAKRRERAHLMVVGTYRETDLNRKHPLTEILADLRKEPCHRRVLLRGLAPEEVQNFLRMVVPGLEESTENSLVEALFAETEGNPFFLGEVVSHLKETQGLREVDGRWSMAAGNVSQLGIPEGVREVVGRRVSRLSEECGAALAQAAVAGREFDLGIVAAMGSLSTERLLDLLDEALGSGLVEEVAGHPDRYRFAHALVRQTLYDEMSMSRRLRLHLQVGEALEASGAAGNGDRLPDLAHHFLEAGAVADVDRTVRYATEAGRRATDQAAYETAAALYRRTLETLELRGERTGQRWCDLQLELGDALLKSGEASGESAFVAAASAARQLGDGERLGHAVLGAAKFRTAFRGGTTLFDAATEAELDEALTVLGAANPGLTSALLARKAEVALDEKGPRAGELAAESVRIARASGDGRALTTALYAWLLVSPTSPSPEDDLLGAAELVATAERLGDVAQALLGRRFMIRALMEMGDMAAADAEIATYGATASRLRLARYEWVHELYGAVRAHMDGRLRDATALGESARRAGNRAGDPNAGVWTSGLMRHIRNELDSLGPPAEGSDRLAALRSSGSRWVAVFAAQLAYESLLAGDEDAARVWFTGLARDGFQQVQEWKWLRIGALLSIVCVGLGEVEHAPRLFEILAPYSERNVIAGGGPGFICLGPVSRYLGLLASSLHDWEEAERQFKSALSMTEKMGTMLWVAHTKHDCASMLAASGDRVRARELATEALQLADDLGLIVVGNKTRALLASF